MKDEWLYLTVGMKLTADLLPVVSNPDAMISPDSKMKDKGKTPSIYNKRNEVAGIPNWTEKQSTAVDIARWMKQPDYGICIQTRNARALDIDVDAENDIAQFIMDHLNIALPMRYRSNSAKCLLAFRIAGKIPKRKMVVEGGIIEFLANGQQFVAMGTHKSGVKYEWSWTNGMTDFPTLTLEQFDVLWKALEDRYAIENSSVGVLRKRGETTTVKDEIIDLLEPLDFGNAGAVYITCPWKDEHTMDSGITETAYFPKGTNGYELGHFKCMHAHCHGRTDQEFMDALGITAKMFDGLAAPEPLIQIDLVDKNKMYTAEKQEFVLDKPLRLPSFQRTKAGEILAVADNVYKALDRPDMCGYQIRFDNFRAELMIAPSETTGQWRTLNDEDYFRLQLTLERKSFQPIAHDLVRRAVNYIGKQNIFDSAIEWINNLPVWDGISRVDTFLPTYFKTVDSLYTRGVSQYIWTALAGRVLSPGCKVDMAVILVGDEGLQKSTAIAAMVPAQDFFTEISFNDNDVDNARKMRGKLIAEIAELRGLHTKEREGILAFMTRTHEDWTPKFKEFNVIFPRRLLMMGTTNKTEIFTGEAGDRRWLPISVIHADAQAIARDRNQLWAEAKMLYELFGINWQVERIAREARKAYVETDPWQEVVERWLNGTDSMGENIPANREFVKINDILREAVFLETNKHDKRAEMRIAKILKTLGYERSRTLVGEHQHKGWTKI